MGRKTWFSIPEKNRPLQNRINIVLSRQLKAPPAGAHFVAADFAAALNLVDSELAERADQVWIIGGSSIYKEIMESQAPRRLIVTRVQKQFECDTFFPEIRPEQFRLLPESFRRRTAFPTSLRSTRASSSDGGLGGGIKMLIKSF
uniref:dihydrofolate reductase n=1 Tax=Oryzias sinensis TaxID=183150 RepID=A0A8C7WUN1_9TELE